MHRGVLRSRAPGRLRATSPVPTSGGEGLVHRQSGFCTTRHPAYRRRSKEDRFCDPAQETSSLGCVLTMALGPSVRGGAGLDLPVGLFATSRVTAVTETPRTFERHT